MNHMPDFIIIGAMKCATSTLHEQLARQPGVFMSTPKEPCFFSDDDVYQRGVSWYQSLFEKAPAGSLRGESSTHYTKLPTYPDTLARMRHHLPERTKFIYIMRHPIDRLVSQYVHEWTQRIVSCEIDEALDRLPILIEYSRYAQQIEPFLGAFGSERVLPVFFERLSSAPQSELERVCRFLGYHGDPVWDDQLKEQNVSSERLRKNALRDAIVEFPGLRTIRRTLVPRSLRDRIKEFWTMKHRPELSQSSRARLVEEFDSDLARLGQWLGLELNCGNFKTIARQSAARWREHSEASVA